MSLSDEVALFAPSETGTFGGSRVVAGYRWAGAGMAGPSFNKHYLLHSMANEMRGRHHQPICAEASYAIGFGTNSGTVAAASNWDEPMQIKAVRPALAGSYERLCHESGKSRFFLPLHRLDAAPPIAELRRARLERAIGVVYRPETELRSHYFEAFLPHQFDEYVWFDETNAVTPLHTEEIRDVPATYPFGL